jgi:hypothetical protein
VVAETESVATTEVEIVFCVVEFVAVTELAIFKIAEFAVDVSSDTPAGAVESVIVLPPVPSVAVKSEWELASPCVVVMVAEPEDDRPGKAVPKNRGAVAA